MNLLSDMMSESVDKSPATSKCMERVVKYVNSTKYLSLFFELIVFSWML